MSKTLAFLLSCTFWLLLILPGFGQNPLKQYVKTEAHVIASLSLDTLDDLQALQKAIGHARIVMLGEQAHGDGTTFLAKTKLIKYLHERMGFSVLAFESDFFALTEGWESTPKDSASISRFFKENLYPIWAYSEACSPLLYEYIPASYKTARPLLVAGIDNQMHGKYTADSLQHSITGFLAAYQVPYVHSEEYKIFFLPFVDTLWRLNSKPKRYLDSLSKTDFRQQLDKFQAAIDTIQHQLPQDLPASVSLLALQNLRQFAEEIYHYPNRISSRTRDEQMARNLTWLAHEKYPTEKIIVWAANTHIMKKGETAHKDPALQLPSLGGYFTRDSTLEKQTYVLGFTSFYGQTQTALKAAQGAPPTLLKKSKRYQFENWVPHEVKYAFIDFRAFKARYPTYQRYFKLKVRGHSSIAARWTAMFDGIFYIQEMQPSPLLKPKSL